MKTSLTICFCAVLLAAAVDAAKEYKIVGDKVSWKDADAACKALNQQLATINCGKEQYMLEQAIKKSGNSDPLWISGNDDGHTGKYVWSTTGQPFDYTNWGANAPSTSDKTSCVYVAPKGDEAPWSNSDCDTKMGYVCENQTNHD